MSSSRKSPRGFYPEPLERLASRPRTSILRQSDITAAALDAFLRRRGF